MKIINQKNKLIIELKNLTGVSLIECKKTLIKFNFNIKRSKEYLINNLKKNIIEKFNIIPKHGLILSKIFKNIGIILEINCETDFTSKHSDFKNFTKFILNIILDNVPNNIKELLNIKLNNMNINDYIKILINKFHENIIINRFKIVNTINNIIKYVHHNNKIGVIVDYIGKNKEAAKNIALHIAALQPIVIYKNQLSLIKLKNQYNIIYNKIKFLNKSKKILNKIINNNLKKYFKEVSLMDQNYIKNEKETVFNFLIKNNIIIKKFYLFILGKY